MHKRQLIKEENLGGIVMYKPIMLDLKRFHSDILQDFWTCIIASNDQWYVYSYNVNYICMDAF